MSSGRSTGGYPKGFASFVMFWGLIHLGVLCVLLVVFWLIGQYWTTLGDEHALWRWFRPAYFTYIALWLFYSGWRWLTQRKR